MSKREAFLGSIQALNEVLKVPVSVATVGSTALLIQMNRNALKSGNTTDPGNNKSNNITVLPGGTVVMSAPNGVQPMKKIAADEALATEAGFSAELGKVVAGQPVNDNAVSSEDVEARRAALNGRQGILGQGGISQASARSVAVNQPVPSI